MPQIAAQYPTNLEGIFGDASLIPGQMAQQMFQTAEKNNQLNQQSAQIVNEYDAKNNPLLLQEKQYGVNALQRSDEIASATQQQAKQLAIKKAANSITDEDLRMHTQIANQLGSIAQYAKANGGRLPPGLENVAELQGMSPDQMQTAADQIIQHSKEVYSERLRQQEETKRAQLVAGIQTSAMLKGKQMEIDAGKYIKPWMVSIDSRIASITKPEDKYVAYLDASKAAEQQGDSAAAQLYKERADNLAQVTDLRLKAGLLKPGSVDLSKMGISINPANPLPKPTQTTQKTVVRTGTAANGKKVNQYSDGTIDYAD